MLIQDFDQVNFPTQKIRTEFVKLPDFIQKDLVLQPSNVTHCDSHGSFHVTKWKPNLEDLERLNRGEDIFFIIHFDGAIAEVKCQLDEPTFKKPGGIMAYLEPESANIWCYQHPDTYRAFIQPTNMVADVEVYGKMPHERRTEGKDEEE